MADMLKSDVVTAPVGMASGATSIVVASANPHQSIISHQSPSQILDYFSAHGFFNSVYDFWLLAPASDWVVFFSVIISLLVLPNNLKNLFNLLKK